METMGKGYSLVPQGYGTGKFTALQGLAEAQRVPGSVKGYERCAHLGGSEDVVSSYCKDL